MILGGDFFASVPTEKSLKLGKSCFIVYFQLDVDAL